MREHLNKIRDIIAGGWCQGALVKPNHHGRRLVHIQPQPGDCFCLMGAINAVIPSDKLHERRSVADQLGRQLPADFTPINIDDGVYTELDRLITFNDADSTTQDDVLALIDKAIAA